MRTDERAFYHQLLLNMDVEETKVSGVSVCLSVCLSYLLPFFFHSLPPILYPSLTFFLSHSLLRGLSLPLFLSLYHSSFPLSSSPLPFPSLTILLFLFSSPLFTLHSLSSFPHRLRSHPSIHSPIQVFVYPRMFSIHDMAEDAGIPSDSAENDGKRGRLLKGVLISCTLPFVFSLLPPPRSLSLSLLLFRLTNPTSFHSPSLPPSLPPPPFPPASPKGQTAGPFNTRLPSILNLTVERLSSDGMYLLENGEYALKAFRYFWPLFLWFF